MKNFVKRYPALSYYLLVFAISWGGTLILIGGPDNIPGTREQAEKLIFPALIIMFAGPFISGILMNYLTAGLEGFRNLLSRLWRWRVKGRWYMLAVFTGPVVVAAVLFGLTILDQRFLPGIITTEDVFSLILFGVAWGLIGGGLMEETGWTGFVVPQLRKRYSIISTGLIVGILWGIWHFLIAFWSSNYMGGSDSWGMFVAGFLSFYLLALPAYRILLVSVYDRTKSLPVIMIMHAFFSASTLIFQPATAGETSFIWNLVLGIVLCIIVVIEVVTNPQYFLQQSNCKH